MRFFDSLKGKAPDDIGGAPPSLPSARYDEHQSSADKASVLFGPSPSNTEMKEEEEYMYSPPDGPPPSRVPQEERTFAPPPGPPPSKIPPENPPPYADWLSVPDNSLLPPPPDLHHQSSPSNNASGSEADRAHRWCAEHHLFTPSVPHPTIYRSVRDGEVLPERPPEYSGDLRQKERSVWKGMTRKSCSDCIVLSNWPLYFAAVDSPLLTQSTRTVYFELKVLRLGRSGGEAGIAIGFCARPYPTWRLPGWERASLGVHSDDGRRFVNDSWGGKDFTAPWMEGETMGIGMTFRVPAPGLGNEGLANAQAEVFFTRGGKREGGWQINEEQDAESDGVEGLHGKLDLYAAIGMFGSVEFEALFDPEKWLYRPRA